VKPLPTDTRRSSANTNRSSNENTKKGISAIPAKKSNKPVGKTSKKIKGI